MDLTFQRDQVQVRYDVSMAADVTSLPCVQCGYELEPHFDDIIDIHIRCPECGQKNSRRHIQDMMDVRRVRMSRRWRVAALSPTLMYIGLGLLMLASHLIGHPISTVSIGFEIGTLAPAALSPVIFFLLALRITEFRPTTWQRVQGIITWMIILAALNAGIAIALILVLAIGAPLLGMLA